MYKNLPVLLLILMISCAAVPQKPEKQMVLEKGSVKIGDQIWMEKNLNVSTFQNGDPIFEAKTKEDWIKCDSLQQPAWCYYENAPSNDSLYGKMYNWYAVNDARKLAPAGWHVASKGEWDQMIEFLGGKLIAGKKLKAKYGWDKNGVGTNESGLAIVAAGERQGDGEFSGAGLLTAFWTSSPNGYEYAWEYVMYHFYDQVKSSDIGKGGGFSVRCVKD